MDLKFKEHEKNLYDKIAKIITESLKKYSKEDHSKIEEVIRLDLLKFIRKKNHFNIENAIRLNLEKFEKEEHSILEKTICEYLTKFEIRRNEKILTAEKKIKNMESTNQKLLLLQIESMKRCCLT